MQMDPKLFKLWSQPRVIITDKLRSYAAALKELIPGIEHRQHKGLNNRAEASHRYTRRREKIMGRSDRRRFLSVHDQIAAVFRPKRHLMTAAAYRQTRTDAFDLWTEYTHQCAP